MKIKILDPIHYQLIPETDDMIDLDITEEQLYEIGRTLCFNENNELVPYVNKNKLLKENKSRLEELTKDLAQHQAGLIIEDIEERKKEFQTLLNEVRVLEGKEPRKIQE